MANTAGIKEVTLEQISLFSHAINVVGDAAGNARLSVYQPAVVRVTNHTDDDGSTGDAVEGMALFHSKAHGQPWKKDDHQTAHIVHRGAAAIVTVSDGTNQTVIYPNFDYTTFE